MTTNPPTTSPAADVAGNGAAAPDLAAIKDLIRGSRRARTTVPLCLRLDLVAEFEDLERQLATTAAAVTAGDGRLNTARASDGRAVAERMADLRDQMQAATVTFTLQALSSKAWMELEEAHPPRKGDDNRLLDADVMGVNSETFFPAAIRACTVAPRLDDDDWRLLLEGDGPAGGGGLTHRQYDALAGAVWRLNKVTVDIPFSSAASRILRAGVPG